MTNSISISELFAVFSLIGGLVFALAIVGMVNGALYGNSDMVDENVEIIEDSLTSEAESLVYEPIMPYVYGGFAFILTGILSLLGINLKFKG